MTKETKIIRKRNNKGKLNTYLYYSITEDDQVCEALAIVRVHIKTGKAITLAGKLSKRLTLDKLFNSKGKFRTDGHNLSATLIAHHGGAPIIQRYIDNTNKKGKSGSRTEITQDLISKVFSLKANGMPVPEITKATALSRQSVYNILSGKIVAVAKASKSEDAAIEARAVNLDKYPLSAKARDLIISHTENIMGDIRAAVEELADNLVSPLTTANSLGVSESMILSLLGNEPFAQKLYRN